MEVSRLLVVLVPPEVLARFSGKILPEPEEVPKKPKSTGENLAGTKTETLFFLVFLVPPQVLARFSPLDFGFFGTSSGSGKVFKENIVKT